MFKGKENGKNNDGFDNLHTILLIHVYATKYVRLNRKKTVENMRGKTPEVAILADVSGAYSAISSVYQCVTGLH